MKPYITILFIAIASLLMLQATDASQESFDWKAALKEVDPSDFDNYQQYYVDLIANPYTYEVTCKSSIPVRRSDMTLKIKMKSFLSNLLKWGNTGNSILLIQQQFR